MVYAEAFFDLQLKFADTVAHLSGLPRGQALLEYTNLYIRFGLGRDFDRSHPRWQEYVAGLSETNDPGEWTYRFYTNGPYGPTRPPIVASVGCFSYSRLRADRIRLHFESSAVGDCSSLGNQRREQRVAELTALFARVKRTEPARVTVVGASWLYNLEAYRRLFPKVYLATARVLPGRFQHMPLWGQFLNRHGAVREDAARVLLARLRGLASLDGLDECFPFPVLTVEASGRDLSEYYGV